jgi:hypothetical protein
VIGVTLDRQVLAITERLRVVLARAMRDDEMEQVRRMFGIRESKGTSAVRAWLTERLRVGRAYAADPDAPDHAWLRRELNQACAAYEAAVGERMGPSSSST